MREEAMQWAQIDIAEVEECARLSWPADDVVALDGWWLRAAQGVTGRANSVWTVRSEGARSLADRVDLAERFYADRGLPCKFQMTPLSPQGLDEELEQRGYLRSVPNWVQSAPLYQILRSTPPLQMQPHLEIEVAEEFDAAWFALYCEAEGATGPAAEVRARILQRIAQPVAFAMATLHGAPAGVGLGVVNGPWMGIFCMSTHPRLRRRGVATALLRTLAIWAGLYDAQGAYLQVKQENAGAIAAYARAGFSVAYPYFYRTRELCSEDNV